MGSASVTQQPTCTSNQAIIQAYANDGYCFTQWSDGISVNPRTTTVTENTTLIAIFTAVPSVTVQSNDSTMGSASVTQQTTCTSNQAIIQATATNGYRFVKWSDDNTQNPRTVTVTQNITLTAIFESSSGIENIKDNQISIYPNPVKGQLQVTSYELQEGALYSIFNVAGQMLMQGKLSYETTVINVETLPSGVYFIKAGNSVGKFVKE